MKALGNAITSNISRLALRSGHKLAQALSDQYLEMDAFWQNNKSKILTQEKLET